MRKKKIRSAEMRQQAINSSQWILQAQFYLFKSFGVTLDDLGITEGDIETAIDKKETPVEFIDYLAGKYDLFSLNDPQ